MWSSTESRGRCRPSLANRSHARSNKAEGSAFRSITPRLTSSTGGRGRSSGTKVNSTFMERTAAEKRYGFRLYQGGAVPGKEIRVVRIGDFDVEACGGIHCKNTLEVGAIKILRTKRIQDGVVRLEFVSGMAAVEQMMSLWNAVTEASARLNTTPERIGEAVDKLLADRKDLTKELDAMKKGRGGETVDELVEKDPKIAGVRIG